MVNCSVCRRFSGRTEICYECALIIWPHGTVNHGARQLARKLMAVPSHPPLAAVPRR
jgi:hypothetical protein